jgi:hypothetical protein
VRSQIQSPALQKQKRKENRGRKQEGESESKSRDTEKGKKDDMRLELSFHKTHLKGLKINEKCS